MVSGLWELLLCISLSGADSRATHIAAFFFATDTPCSYILSGLLSTPGPGPLQSLSSPCQSVSWHARALAWHCVSSAPSDVNGGRAYCGATVLEVSWTRAPGKMSIPADYVNKENTGPHLLLHNTLGASKNVISRDLATEENDRVCSPGSRNRWCRASGHRCRHSIAISGTRRHHLDLPLRPGSLLSGGTRW